MDACASRTVLIVGNTQRSWLTLRLGPGCSSTGSRPGTPVSFLPSPGDTRCRGTRRLQVSPEFKGPGFRVVPHNPGTRTKHQNFGYMNFTERLHVNSAVQSHTGAQGRRGKIQEYESRFYLKTLMICSVSPVFALNLIFLNIASKHHFLDCEVSWCPLKRCIQGERLTWSQPWNHVPHECLFY